ncbi:hypothetical protein CVG87_22075 [Pseudomonas sp. WCS365]|nr:hypothetical protein CVG87_22075 [Pseudomonas sp. WCS365]
MPVHHRSPVGASLLSKAVGQLASMLDVLPPSRAGSLPQYFETASKFLPTRKSLVGAGLLAKAVGQLASMLDVLPPSRASSLPQYFETVSKFLPTANPLWERACSRWRQRSQ